MCPNPRENSYYQHNNQQSGQHSNRGQGGFQRGLAEVALEEDVMEVMGKVNSSMIEVIKAKHFKMSKIRTQIPPLAIILKTAKLANYAIPIQPSLLSNKIRVKVQRKSFLTVKLLILIS